MELTNAQKNTLRTYVQADPVLGQIAQTSDGAFELADALNMIVDTFFVWKSSVVTEELFDGVQFSAVDALTVGKARIFEWMILSGTVRPASNGIRTAITQCFGAGTASETGILALMKRTATRLESVLANTSTGGAGNGAEGTPAKLRVEGLIDLGYLREVMGW